jgi:hypothetical protein
MTETTIENESPSWWDWAEDADGPIVAGTFVRAGKGYTANGERPFVVLDVGDGVERTVWLHHTVLQRIFAREVRRRPSKRIEVGERVELCQVGERDGGNGRSYVNYRAEFPDGPASSQLDIFGPLDDDEPAPSAQASNSLTESGEPDGDIPF